MWGKSMNMLKFLIAIALSSMLISQATLANEDIFLQCSPNIAVSQSNDSITCQYKNIKLKRNYSFSAARLLKINYSCNGMIHDKPFISAKIAHQHKKYRLGCHPSPKFRNIQKHHTYKCYNGSNRDYHLIINLQCRTY